MDFELPEEERKSKNKPKEDSEDLVDSLITSLDMTKIDPDNPESSLDNIDYKLEETKNNNKTDGDSTSLDFDFENTEETSRPLTVAPSTGRHI